MADPQNGKLGVQSAMNRAIWRTLASMAFPSPIRSANSACLAVPLPGTVCPIYNPCG